MKIRGLAERMRLEAGETADSFYQRMLTNAALELEGEAERIDRADWEPSHH